ncbi:MAG: isochorismatase family protein [Desulfobacteraceae bacterium]
MFSRDDTALVLIDIQGRLATLMHEQQRLYNSLEILVKGMNILKIPMIWMEQVPSSLGPTVKEVSDLMGHSTPIAKNTFSCCDSEEFMNEFNRLGRSGILLAGIETHICVYQTAADLVEKGCRVKVVEECVSSRTLNNKQIGLEAIKGIGGTVTSCEMILFELMKSTEAEGFKEIVRLIK